MARARNSKYWRSCPTCGQQTYDLNLYKPGRKFFRCPNGHVWHPDPAEDDESKLRSAKKNEGQSAPKRSWFDRLLGE